MAKATNTKPKQTKPVVEKEVKTATPKPSKAEKVASIVKKVDVAVDKIAAKKVTPKQAVEALGKSIATIAETKQAKKSVEKVAKEAELGRRLSRAKSSLAAGLAAAMKTDPSKEGSKEVTEKSITDKTPTAAYMTKPVTAAVKKPSTISFDDLATVGDMKPTSKPVKPASNKVSFDQLMENNAKPAAESFDVTAYLKK